MHILKFSMLKKPLAAGALPLLVSGRLKKWHKREWRNTWVKCSLKPWNWLDSSSRASNYMYTKMYERAIEISKFFQGFYPKYPSPNPLHRPGCLQELPPLEFKSGYAPADCVQENNITSTRSDSKTRLKWNVKCICYSNLLRRSLPSSLIDSNSQPVGYLRKCMHG